jgi:zinc transport system substrate-binding protein
MRISALTSLCSSLLFGLYSVCASAQPNVLATIKPLQMVAAAVMDGVATPALLIPSQQTPHYFTLRPSDAMKLRRADIILWVGPQMETFLADAIDQSAASAKIIQGSGLDGVHLLNLVSEDDDEHSGHIDHAHGYDTHLWLDVQNVQLIAESLVEQLHEIDPSNDAKYAANLAQFTARLEQLRQDLRVEGERIQGGGYVVYHNGTQYLEHQLGIQHLFVIVPNHDIQPGIRHLLELRELVQKRQPSCLLQDVNTNPATVNTVFGNTQVRKVSLDAMGDCIALGPDSYIELMARLTRNISLCIVP